MSILDDVTADAAKAAAVAAVASQIIEALLDLVGPEIARNMLDDGAVKRQEAIANAAEDLKFPPSP